MLLLWSLPWDQEMLAVPAELAVCGRRAADEEFPEQKECVKDTEYIALKNF